MLAKLAARNVRRSVRDYAIYFVTLVLGVAVFYAFNSIGDQQILFEVEQAGGTARGSLGGQSVFAVLTEFMSLFSVAVACALGFLVLYANRYLIRRRKREFGTYLLLGMRPAQVSAIVLMETLLVGVASLMVGIAAGVAVSQGLSFLTAALFGTTMERYQFVFSKGALVQTLVCFAALFAVVAVFNTVQVARCRLTALLSARAVSERMRVRNPWVCLAAFAVSVGILAWAYATLDGDALTSFGAEFRKATVLMLAGTLLLFWSLAGFVLLVLQRWRAVYFKGLAMFTMRQIAAKVNTAFVSLWAVCVLLFFSITVFSTGMGMASVFVGDLEENTLFDETLQAAVYYSDPDRTADDPAEQFGGEEAKAAVVAEQRAEYEAIYDAWAESGWDTAAYLASIVPEWGTIVEASAQFDVWCDEDLTYGEVAERLGVSAGSAGGQVADANVEFVGVSQFNAVRVLAGRDPIEVPEGCYAVDNALEGMADLSNRMGAQGEVLHIAGHDLVATGDVVRQGTMVSQATSVGGLVIVPDSAIDGLRAQGKLPRESALNLVFAGDDAAASHAALAEALGRAMPPSEDLVQYGWAFDSRSWPVTFSYNAASIVEEATGMKLLLTYLALYMGFVLLITTAAVLAVQQLSEAADSMPRYTMLAQLGCDRRMVFRSLRIQVAVYFLAPLALAACHAAYAMGIMSDALLGAWGISAGSSMAGSAVMVALVYGGYLAVTYLAARSAIRASLGKRLLG